MAPPTSRKGVINFIGVINYYRDMWPRRSHTVAPLTKSMSIKRRFKWTQVKQDAFDKIKQIGARDTFLTCITLMVVQLDKIMSQITRFHSGCGYYRRNIRILWKYPRFVDIIRISQKYPRSVDTVLQFVRSLRPQTYVTFIGTFHGFPQAVGDIVHSVLALQIVVYIVHRRCSP